MVAKSVARNRAEGGAIVALELPGAVVRPVSGGFIASSATKPVLSSA